MKYAVILTGGKQYKVSEGDVIEIEKLKDEAGQKYSFDKVLLYVSDGLSRIGHPYLNDVVVSGNILEQLKGEKIRVSKFKAKARYRKVQGHRQLFTKIKIEKISSSTKEEDKKVQNKKTEEKITD